MSDVLIAKETIPADVIEIVAVGPQGPQGEVGDVNPQMPIIQAAAEAARDFAQAAKSSAETSATNAAGSASLASTSATNAANSATTAGNKATAAATSATNASTSATNAANSAMAAGTSASNASNSAVVAAAKADQASNSAIAASTSASYVAGLMPYIESTQNKNIPNGYAGLDESGVIHAWLMPLLDKNMVGLDLVDNTPDSDKPVSSAQQAQIDSKVSRSFPSSTGTLTHSGDILLAGSGRRITGDFSNAIYGNRGIFQTSIINGQTYITAAPNGAGTVSGLWLCNSSNVDSGTRISMTCSASQAQIWVGGGVNLPLSFVVGGPERLRMDTSGNVLLTSSGGGLGYGTGAGGVVTQPTNKSTSVTLNKPTGQITMSSAALAASATVSFSCFNSIMGSTDTVIVSSPFSNTENYRVEVRKVYVGGFDVFITNLSGVSLSDALTINFTIIKGAMA